MAIRRTIAAFGLLAILTAHSTTLAAPPDPTLHSDPKYAWPRAGELVLDGQWQLAYTQPPKEVALPKDLGQLAWFGTQVPAEVHWALHRAGKAPHPYVGLNAQSLRWVEDVSWWFRKRFTVPNEFRAQQVRLMAEGVDYYAHYWLNGKYLGRSEGAFGAAKFILDNVRYGRENELIVRVDCGGYKLGKKGGAPPASLVKSELWSGWAIGAKDFNTVGIWQPLRLVANDWPCLERPFLRTVNLADKQATVRATVEVCTIQQDAIKPDKAAEKPYRVTVAVRGKGWESPPVTGTVEVRPLGGTVLADVDLTVANPRLWWPNGLGEQPQYEAEIVLSRDGKPLDRLTVPFAIRTIERKQGQMQRTSYEATEWIFHVNGRPMFVKGTNWMPIDALGDVSPENYEWHLSMMRDAGIQMIRIWGGGILETEAFYDLCDRYGLMVWQDFPLTCGWEAAQINRTLWTNTVMWTIFRLRNHPSLAFWCGGNEFPPDSPANRALVAAMSRWCRLLDGTRPFMAASPDEGDIHSYQQWDASWAWRSELVRGPFISEWGSHGMPSPQTYAQIVSPKEADARIGPTLLKMDPKLMQQAFPEITYHWVEFQRDRLPQMLSRGSAFDQLAATPLGRFSEAINAGAAEFYKYSAEAARFGYPQNGGLLFWVWKRPWPICGIQICDGLGQPLATYYDVKRGYSSPWPCLIAPHLNYVPGEKVELRTAVLTELARPDLRGASLSLRILGPDLRVQHACRDLPAIDVPAGPTPVAGPTVVWRVPESFARSFFLAVLELQASDGARLARNVYAFRCPAELEDAAFRERYRAKPQPALLLDKGPWLRPQLEKHPTQLGFQLLATTRESHTRTRVRAEVTNVGRRPAAMVEIRASGNVQYVADDALFWLEPGEKKTVNLRVRTDAKGLPAGTKFRATAWNAP